MLMTCPRAFYFPSGRTRTAPFSPTLQSLSDLSTKFLGGEGFRNCVVDARYGSARSARSPMPSSRLGVSTAATCSGRAAQHPVHYCYRTGVFAVVMTSAAFSGLVPRPRMSGAHVSRGGPSVGVSLCSTVRSQSIIPDLNRLFGLDKKLLFQERLNDFAKWRDRWHTGLAYAGRSLRRGVVVDVWGVDGGVQFPCISGSGGCIPLACAGAVRP